MATSAALFAFMNFFAKLASSSASWASVGAVRALVGAGVAFLVGRSRGSRLRAVNRRTLFWRSLFGTASMLCTFYALSCRALSLGDAVTLLNLTPVFLAVVAPVLLRERTARSTALAIVVALAGVVLVVRPAFLFGVALPAAATTAGPSAAVGAGAAVASALLAAVAMTMLRRSGQEDSAEAIALHFSLFAFVAMLVFAAADPRLPSARDAAFMVAAGVAAGFAQLAMTRAYTLERAARVGSLSYFSVVVGAVLGAVVLGERPTLLALLGMALVVGSGLLVTFAPSAPEKVAESTDA